MEATITENGTLQIRPTTPMEAFALRAWWDGFDKPFGEQRTILQVLPLPAPPGENL